MLEIGFKMRIALMFKKDIAAILSGKTAPH